MPPSAGKRARDEADDATAQELRRTAAEFSRHKSAVDEAFAELLCPITQSLPVDPVMAEDGKVYERDAIEKWLESHQRSPLTNVAMGTKLLPALQNKNMIRAMVKSGALTGEKVDAWKEKLAEEEEVAEKRRRAEAGSGAAMFNLGRWYLTGEMGLAEDEAKAFEWYSKSHEAGDASATGELGCCYLFGFGVEKCPMRAATLLTDGARGGSKCACYILGLRYADGAFGFPKDLKLARRYYSMVATASEEDLAPDDVAKAAAWVRDHPA